MGMPLDLLGTQMFVDPYPIYDALRAMGPVTRVDSMNGWFVTDMEACREALRDHRRFSSQRARQMLEAMVPDFRFDTLPPMAQATLPRTFLFLDPPDHTRIRQLFAPLLQPPQVQQFRTLIDETVRELMAVLDDRDTIDLQNEIAARLPVMVMGHWFQLSPELRDHLQLLTYRTGPLFGASPALADPAALGRILRDVQAFHEAMAGPLLAGPPSRSPLLACLRRAVESGALTTAEALGLAIQVFTAGMLTTGDTLGIAALELLTTPTLQTAIGFDPASLTRTVNELVRFVSPAQIMHRVVREDTELGGQALRAGDLLYVVIAAANRDPRCFARPHVLDFDREQASAHLGFGVGVHYCVGAWLGRMELEAALRALVPRLAQWELAEPPRYRTHTIVFRGLEHLRLRRRRPAKA